jgi:hypothetical protein
MQIGNLTYFSITYWKKILCENEEEEEPKSNLNLVLVVTLHKCD